MQGYLQEARLLNSCYSILLPSGQFCLYSLSCWERPPESVVFEIASSINIKTNRRKKEEMGEGDLALERGMVVSELGS